MPSRSVFDGRSLTLYRSDGSIAGSWPAISGKNGDQRPSSQNLPFRGPLTEGRYSFSTDNIQPMTTLDAAMGIVGRGLFPKSVPAWGTERAALVPESRPTNGRGKFFVHGGIEPGSAGCIDLGPNEKAYFDAVRSTGESSHEVIVNYDPSLETSRHPLAGRRLWDGAGEYVARPLPSPIFSSPEHNEDSPHSYVDRFGKRGTGYAGGPSSETLPAYVGPDVPFVATPAGSLPDSGGQSFLDPKPMDPGVSRRFSTGGRFVPRSSLPQPLYPTGSLVPNSIGRAYDRQGLLDDRSRYEKSSRGEDAHRFPSPVLRELRKYRQLAVAGVAAGPSSAAHDLGIPRATSGVGGGAGGVRGGVVKWIGNGLIPSAEASSSNFLPEGSTRPDALGGGDGPILDTSETASLSAKDNRRYLTRRVAGQKSAFDTGAPAVPFVSSNAGLAPDHPNSFDDRFGSWMSTGEAEPLSLLQQASTPARLLRGEPMLNKVVPPSIFGLPDRSGSRGGSAGDRELDGSQGTGIPLLDEYIRYLNREYGA